MEPDTPAPPPEARLIRTAREAAGMTAAQAAQATDGAVSAGYWRDVERGYGGRRGQRAAARASDKTLAAMARVTGVTPGQLNEVQREDAARVLAEILRREESAARPDDGQLRAVPSQPHAEPGSPSEVEFERIMRKHGDDPVVKAIAAQHGGIKKTPVILAELLEWLDYKYGSQARNGTAGLGLKFPYSKPVRDCNVSVRTPPVTSDLLPQASRPV